MDIIDAVINKIPSPKVENDGTKALIFDSYFDPYRGVIASVCVKSGKITTGDEIVMMSNGASFMVTELGVNTPDEKIVEELNTGSVGWVCASIKEIDKVRVGDTITTKRSNYETKT